MTKAAKQPRTQAQRSAQMRTRLVDAAISVLVERGYAYASTVEICARAGVTRGAYNHHFSSLEELFLETLEALYERLAEAQPDRAGEISLADLIRRGWARSSRVEFKAVIELWLASRNDPDLGKALAPAIARLSRVFAPAENQELAKILSVTDERVAIYRLAFEAMIGLALGRATSPNGAAVEHEQQVIDLLVELAERSAPSAKAS